jgi:hypothetical protein
MYVRLYKLNDPKSRAFFDLGGHFYVTCTGPQGDGTYKILSSWNCNF